MQRHISHSILVAAPIERVWAATVAVTHWPDWASTITSVHQLEGDGMQIGSRFVIKQPMQTARVWGVTGLIPGKSFSWRSEGRFLTWVASHELSETSSNDVTVTLRLGISGQVAGILWPLLRKVLSLAIQKECADLKAWCEHKHHGGLHRTSSMLATLGIPASQDNT